MNNDTISVLCPTRGRSGLLIASIRVLMHLAARPNRIEVLLGVDPDDETDYAGDVWPHFAPKGKEVQGRVLRAPQRFGYAGLNNYYNALARAATGKWLMLWNDDVIMATYSWDYILDGIPGDLAVAMTESNHGRSPCTFPFFTKKYVDTIGHVSLNPHNDTWIEEVGVAAGINIDVPILVVHANLEDKTAREGKGEDLKSTETSRSYYTDEMKALRAKDVEKLIQTRVL